MISREYASTEFIIGIRALAVLMVFMIHSGGGGLVELFEYGERVVSLGKHGVDIFFVISGFTIFFQVYEKNYKIKNFILVRLARISIPYFPLLIVFYLYLSYGGQWSNYWAALLSNNEVSLMNLLMHLSYLSFLDIRYANTIIGVEWTLSVEVFYYFLLGFIVIKFRKNMHFTLLLKMFFITLFFNFLILYITFHNEVYQLYALWTPFRYGYMFVLGGMAYFLRKEFLKRYSEPLQIKISNSVLLFLTMLLLWFVLGIFVPKSNVLNELFFALFTFVLLVSINDNALLSKIFLRNKIFVFIGSISFSFYLYHMLVLNLPFLAMDIENISIKFLYHLVLTIMISTLSYLVFERKVYFLVKNHINKGDRKC